MPRPKKEQPNRKDGLYEVKITTGKTLDGKLIRKSFYSSISKDDARRQAEEWKINQKVAQQTGNIFVEKSVTFADWARKWLEIYKKPNVSANTYKLTYLNSVEKHLIPYFKNAELSVIQPADIQKFYNIKQSDLSLSMMKKLKLCLNDIFETAIENDLSYKNPARRIEVQSSVGKHEKKVYGDLQIQLVKNYAKKHMPEVVILLETGLRRGELLGLKWEDIDYKNLTLSVSRSITLENQSLVEKPPKWDSYRTLPLNQSTIQIFQSLEQTGNYIFPSSSGDAQTPNTWSQKLARFMANIQKKYPDIPPLTAHELRHTYGTQLRRKGVDIYTIQKVLGHKDINVTSKIYVHNELEALRKALNL